MAACGHPGAALSSCWKIILCVVAQRLIKSAVQLRAHILQSRWQARFHPEISENLERPKSGVFHKIVIDIFLFGSSFKQYESGLEFIRIF